MEKWLLVPLLEFEGVLGGPGFALGGDGSGGMRGVGAVPDSDRW